MAETREILTGLVGYVRKCTATMAYPDACIETATKETADQIDALIKAAADKRGGEVLEMVAGLTHAVTYADQLYLNLCRAYTEQYGGK